MIIGKLFVMSAQKKLIILSLMLLLLVLVSLALVGGRVNDAEDADQPKIQQESASLVDSIQTADEPTLEVIKQFKSSEFKQAYDDLSLPNITPIVLPPAITGNIEADIKIQSLAEARGYRLRDVVSGLLNRADNTPVQELLINSWLDLKQRALEDGVQIEITSGYRSIEEQKQIFLDRLYAAGATVDGISSGTDDAIVEDTLAITAPPGYSRHHGGYTIDVEDPGSSVFEGSRAHAWIKENNFEKAKLFGFIPSYPDGLTNQGPNPEPWEYVWVSRSVTYE